MTAISLIIPTYNRPDDLEVCLRSVLEQSRLPDEIIIIDDGLLKSVPYAERIKEQGVSLLYHKKDIPGLTVSRNIGIQLSTGELIFFLDDDVKLLPDYIANIAKVFAGDERIGGVAGRIVNTKPVTGLRLFVHWYECFFLISGRCEGRILKSGFCVDYGDTPSGGQKLAQVDFMPGGVSAYRRKVFDKYLFSTDIGSGQGEDKDFSVRVGRLFPLFYTPEAKLYHFESPKMRFDQFQKGEKFIKGRHRFFVDYLESAGVSSLFFYYAMFGYCLKRVLIFCVARQKQQQWQRLRGIAAALSAIVKSKK